MHAAKLSRELNKLTLGDFFASRDREGSVPPQLSAFLKSVEQGSDSTSGRTNLFPDEDPSHVLARWMTILEPIEQDWPTLWKYEEDLSKKVGPMAYRKPLDDRMPDILSYYQHVDSSYVWKQDPVAIEAMRSLENTWSTIKHRIQLRSQVKTVDNMKLSTSSGSPFWTRRSRVMHETVPALLEIPLYKWPGSGDTYTNRSGLRISNFSSTAAPMMPIQDLPDGKYYATAVLGWRGQEGGPTKEDVKQRSVWMFPFAVNVLELQVYQPLIKAMQTNHFIAPWLGNQAVDERITALFDTKAETDAIVCTDFTKFDQHFNEACQLIAHDILSWLLSDTQISRDWLELVFPVKYNIPLVISPDQICVGRHGMGSGSGGTNADETLTHTFLQHLAAASQNTTLNPNSMCLGDDGILTFPGITAEKVVDTYTKLGLDMNLDKQYVSADDCVFLRRWHHKDYKVNGLNVGVYSTARALGHLLYTERMPTIKGLEYKKQTALRQISILQNLEFHPMREEFAQFCIKGDKYRLGLDIPGFIENIGSVAQKAIDQIPDYVGYVRGETEGIEGIDSWWIVQYLRSLK